MSGLSPITLIGDSFFVIYFNMFNRFLMVCEFISLP